MANLIALIYNWWNLYARFYDEAHHREAICACVHERQMEAPSPLRSGSSRPALMQGVGRIVQSGGQRTVKVSLVHEQQREEIAELVSQTSQQLHRISVITEQWSGEEKWTLLLTRLLRRWLGGKWLPGLPDEAKLLLSG